jgi:hypothetical protein
VPSAGVSGTGKFVSPGLYEVHLNSQGKSLACKLRLAQQGSIVILYLSDEPFRQMTYQRK